MNKEITINKQAKSITIINNGIAFSQFGIAKEILDLIDNQQQEIDRLNNIINELEKYLKENIKLTKTAVHFEILDDYDTRKYKRDIALFEMVLDKLKELKDSD